MMSLRAYAAHRRTRRLPGGTLRSVQEALATGRIPVGAEGTIDPAVADKAWAANTDSSRRPHTRKGEPSTLSEAKRRESIQRERQLRLENDRREGRLVDAGAVEQSWTRQVVEARTAMLGLPTRLKGRRPNLTREDLAALDAVLREALEALADGRPSERKAR